WSWWQSDSGALHYTSGNYYQNKPEVRINFKVNGILGAGMEYVMSVGIKTGNSNDLWIDASNVDIYYLTSPLIFDSNSAPTLPADAVHLSNVKVNPFPKDDRKIELAFTPTEDLKNGYIYLAFNGEYDNPEGNNIDVYSAELSVPHTATFKNGDAVVSTLKGVAVTAPNAVSIDGFQFVGWADANDHSKLYKAGSKIKLTEDATFVAAGIDVDSNYGASLRWSAEDAKRGLRFTTVVRSNLGGADETNKLVSPAQVKTLITDANGTVKEVLNSSTEGGNSRWAEESTPTDLCWHGSVTEFAGKAEEVLTRNFHAQGVVVVNYADNTSAEISGTVSADANMKDIAQDVYEQNPYANGTSVKNVLKEVYNVG
ncbi:MAG: InlB B-repeat-containing protein, partial [Acutalibacteraceae bacterium]